MTSAEHPEDAPSDVPTPHKPEVDPFHDFTVPQDADLVSATEPAEPGDTGDDDNPVGSSDS